MKKQNLLILSTSLLLLVGCAGNNNTTAPYEYEDGYFYAKIMYPNGAPVVGTYVRWCEGEMCARPILVDNYGIAKIAERDVTYNVHLTLPDGINYTYNPAQYTQNSSNKILEITLDEITTPKDGDGKQYSSYVGGMEVGGPFRVGEGTYRATINSNNKNDIQYYGFTPSKPGIYTIESWVEVTELPDPVIGNYGNSPSFLYYSEGDDNSGEGNNFKYQFEVLPDNFEYEFYYDDDGEVQYRLDEEGHPILKTDSNGQYIPMARYTFGLGSNNAFPVTYDFNISFTSDYVYPVNTVVNAEVKEELTKFADSQFDLIDIDLTGSDSAIYNKEDGYYHLNDENGPVIVTHISSRSKYIDKPFSIIEQSTGTAVLTVNMGQKSYSDFIAEYTKYCNSDGVYPLNNELITFLQELAEARRYFGNTGWISGLIEEAMGDKPYTLNSASDYLYACAYYKDDGSEENPRTINVSRNATHSALVDVNENFYYKFTPKKSLDITLTPDENTVIHYQGEEYTSELPLVISSNKGTEYTFYVSRKDSSKGTVSFDVTLPPASEQIDYGENEIETSFTGVEITFINNDAAAHTYHIYSEDTNCLLVDENNTNYVGGSTNNGFIFTLNPGETYHYYVCTYDYSTLDSLVTFIFEIVE